MEILLALLCVLLLCSMTLTWLLLRMSLRAQELAATKAAEVVAAVVSVHASQAQLLDKTLALLSAKGPLEFQAIQAMSQAAGYTDDRYDPSDEAEADRLRAFGMIPGQEEGTLNGNGSDDEELEWLRSHGVA